MKPYDLRIDPTRTVERFFDALFSGRSEVAAQMTTDDFTWFGAPIADWTEMDASLATTSAAANLRPVEPGILAYVEADSPLGEIEPQERVVLVDITRDGATGTVAVVIRGDRVARVLDAMPLRTAIEAREAETLS